MSKKFEKLRISFGKRTESHKDKSWSTGLLLKIQQAKKILAVQSRALRKAAKLTRLSLTLLLRLRIKIKRDVRPALEMTIFH